MLRFLVAVVKDYLRLVLSAQIGAALRASPSPFSQIYPCKKLRHLELTMAALRRATSIGTSCSDLLAEERSKDAKPIGPR
jgi:hypothetical protein